MRRTWRALIALGVGVLIGGCEDKNDTSPVADPAVTAVTATPSSSAASVVKAEPAVNRYFHPHTLPGVVSSFAVGTAVVVCDGGCTAPKAEKAPPPTMWLVETESVKKDPSLWPGNAFYDQLHRVRMSEDDDLGGLPRFTFDGEYPGDLYAHWVGGNTGERVPSWGHLPPAKYRGKHWGLVDMQTEATNRREKEVPPLPPEVETLVASAPVTEGAPRERLVHGGGAPVMAIEAQRIHIHGEGGWRSVDAPLPGSVAQRARLTDGATMVVVSDGVYVVSKTGEGEVIHEGRVRALPLADRLAFETSDGKGTTIYMPNVATAATMVAVYLPEPKPEVVAEVEKPSEPEKQTDDETEKPEAAKGAGGAATSPTASAAPAVSAAPAEGPAPRITGFSSRCKAPLVVVSTPPHAGWDYDTTAEALKGLEAALAGKLTFVEIDGEVVVFGAVAADEEAARKLLDELKERIPKARPRLECFVPIDLGAPPPKVRVIRFHFPSGTLLPP